ncbi:Lon protease family protein [Budviciaceae bacterium BWR-B9]|uniref:endopeptidase La n=1 Tax=Limnobaculum allomyrinae TaxID=2791986 RepID=A0ABS1ISI8_9GAMM|nr:MULTISPECIES: Lon protease family protein [Limnobaculum]MBK5144720.1 Lon protease family protein [Limnobaculum allomyrinae]MBV7692383.1 Lon protease family protein [Limnobaculum sp. M2-1]
MTINRLEWQQLLPNTAACTGLFEREYRREPLNIAITQPRLQKSLHTFCHQHATASPFMLIKAVDSRAYLSLIHDTVKNIQPTGSEIFGSRYEINNAVISRVDAQSKSDNFAATDDCLYEEWLETEQLFGCLRKHNDSYTLEPGLIHKANGGILILSVRTLLTQPHLWFRLKQAVVSQRFQWFSVDDTRPLPLSIPSMPLELKVILVGDRYGLGELQELEPELIEQVIYTEFETDLVVNQDEDIVTWCEYLNSVASHYQLPSIDASAYPSLINIAVRKSGDQEKLPLCPQLLSHILSDAVPFAAPAITAQSLEQSEQEKLWRESYLSEMVLDDIDLGQVRIETEGFVIGQINGLSVLEYPGHPRAMGEPSRISCVVHLGDGEITDVERKSELGGNLHAKGIMIMQAFIAAELASDQQFPFSGSIVFEQSYGEVDGDSASLAGLCALMSALSQQPINQQIAVTGSVDQFGNVQTIGGINEKIEGFFDVCNSRELTGSQGVILPLTNIRHLCLKNDVVEAVKAGRFHLWAIDHAQDALPLLTGLPYVDENKPSIIGSIQERITQVAGNDRNRLPWPFRWLNWFNRG